MEVLRSGSFVNLESREKIEQLIFTAKELAVAACRTEGFVSSGESNQKLALQMWDGAEYVCRDGDLATIRNIFLSNFLQKLREAVSKPISNHPTTPNTIPPPPTAQTQTTASVGSATAPVDRKPDLVVELDEEAERPRSYADECIPEGERLDESRNQEQSVETIAVAEADPTQADEPEPNLEKEQQATETAESLLDEITAKPVATIVLKDKEPYNFEGCTVTAVVQLLPDESGVRKCVVSVRTHEFSPLVEIGEVTTPEPLLQISAALGRAFEQYRSELSAKAADKIKNEKPAAKKISKPAATSKTTKPITTAVKTADTSSAMPPSASPPTHDQQGLFGS